MKPKILRETIIAISDHEDFVRDCQIQAKCRWLTIIEERNLRVGEYCHYNLQFQTLVREELDKPTNKKALAEKLAEIYAFEETKLWCGFAFNNIEDNK